MFFTEFVLLKYVHILVYTYKIITLTLLTIQYNFQVYIKGFQRLFLRCTFYHLIHVFTKNFAA